MIDLSYREILKSSFETPLGINIENKKIYILSDATLEPLEPVLKYFLMKMGIRSTIIFAPIDTINIQLLDLNSELYRSSPDIVFIHNCSQGLFSKFHQVNGEDKLSETVDHIIEGCSFFRERAKAPILIGNLISPIERIFGSLDRGEKFCLYHQVRKLNDTLDLRAKTIDDCIIFDIDSLANYQGLKNVYNDDLWSLGKIPFNYDFFVSIGERLAAILRSRWISPVKCIVLDLDNTLWGGVVGDDGVEGILLSTDGDGEKFYRFQLFLKSLKNRGILLAIASKNERLTALQAIEKHPAMILNEMDFSSIKINWHDKAANIAEIAQELNIHIDSILFIDDNPFERNQVKSALPSIQVGEIDPDLGSLVEQISKKGFFESYSFSEQDKLRNEQYFTNKKRSDLQKSFKSIGDYLKNLKMKASVSEISEKNINRVVELTNRTNQFNLRTKRYSRVEYLRFVKSSEYKCFAVNLEDRFGDYGLISVIVLKIGNGEVFIDQWLTSCRVVSRTLDEFIMNYIIRVSVKLDKYQIVGEYIPTSKNLPVQNFYNNLGFSLLRETEGSSFWSIEIDENKKYNTYIEGGEIYG